MRILPRRSETDPIVALLESDAYADARSLAGAIVVQAYESLLRREWWLTVVRVGESVDGTPLQVVYGLSPTERAAEVLELGGGCPRIVLPVSSAVGHIDRLVVQQKWSGT